MDFVRRARSPWGDDVLLGLSWDLFWAAVIAGAIFVVAHAYFSRRKKRESGAGRSDVSDPQLPAKVERHNRSARVSHWILAATVLVLLATAFVPILGLGFPWVTIHWIAGIVLAAYIVYHIADTVARKTLGTMWITGRELSAGFARLRGFVGRADGPEEKPGKWGVENKLFHHLTAVAGFAVVATGLFMMFRVDTFLWSANPYVGGLSDQAWGWIYVLHGLASVAFVGLLMAHIYFAVRPDNLWITRSMFKGWITREEYLQHHDPDRWPANGGRPAPEGHPPPTPAPTATAPTAAARPADE